MTIFDAMLKFLDDLFLLATVAIRYGAYIIIASIAKDTVAGIVEAYIMKEVDRYV